MSVMNENVYKVLNRGEKIGDLVKKTEDMQNQVQGTARPPPVKVLSLCACFCACRCAGDIALCTDELRLAFSLACFLRDHQANKFNKAGTALRDKMWWANFRSKLFFYGVIAIVVLVVFFWLCGDCLVPSDSGSTTTGATTGNSTEQAASVGSSWVIFDTNMG